MPEAQDEVRPEPDFHDGDEPEYGYCDGVSVLVEAQGVKIEVRAEGEESVQKAQELLDKAVETVAKLRTQVQ